MTITDDRGKLQVTSPREGHTTITWDPSVEESVENARQEFRALSRHSVIYKIDPDGEREQVREFDPHESRYVVVPQLQGG